MSDVAKRWGQLIRQKRTHQGLTQEALGQRIGDVPQPHISRWESGERTPPADVQARLVELLAISADELHAVYADRDAKEGAA